MKNPFRHTVFLKSAAKPGDFPPDRGAEVAFIGRSNAGKSSAINAICEQTGLARTSKTPGRTQLVNFFTQSSENSDHRLIDLPGYGYAKAARSKQREWGELSAQYFEQRQCLKGVVIIMDIRHPLTPKDEALLEWITPLELPLLVLLTKADKLKRGAAKTTLLGTQKELREFADVQLFSAHSDIGHDDVRKHLYNWLTN